MGSKKASVELEKLWAEYCAECDRLENELGDAKDAANAKYVAGRAEAFARYDKATEEVIKADEGDAK